MNEKIRIDLARFLRVTKAIGQFAARWDEAEDALEALGLHTAIGESALAGIADDVIDLLLDGLGVPPDETDRSWDEEAGGPGEGAGWLYCRSWAYTIIDRWINGELADRMMIGELVLVGRLKPGQKKSRRRGAETGR